MNKRERHQKRRDNVELWKEIMEQWNERDS